MINRLEAIQKRYDEISNELLKPEIVSDIKKMTELSKEQRRLNQIVELYQKYKADADKLPNVHFGGRLGQYKYYDMDKVILEALNYIKTIN